MERKQNIDMPQATIVGAGIAGLSAALRLVERGFAVTVLEQNKFAGGKLSAHRSAPEFDDVPGLEHPPQAEDQSRPERPHALDYHEHSYHMYLNWYHNFWQIVGEMGIAGHFRSYRTCCYLDRDGTRARPVELHNVGSVATVFENMFSGLTTPIDMAIYGCSLLDLLGTPSGHAQLEHTSVYAFMRSRAYMTKGALKCHGETLAKAFATPTDATSSHSYRNFINYGFRSPDPMITLLQGNTQECLIRPLLRHIARRAREAGASFRLRPLARVARLLIEDGRVAGFEVRTPTISPSLDPVHRPGPDPEPVAEPVDGAVILAVPPAALGHLVSEEVFRHAPELARVRKLRSQPMASIDVYFKRRIANVPNGITVLMDSELELTFLDNSQAWGRPHAEGPTFLNVVISDFRMIAPYSTTIQGRRHQMEQVFAELRHYLDFRHDPDSHDDDIDRERCYLQTNIGEQLFTNEVGSWENRPTTTCGIPNLFIAGDYCRTFIDVTTIEGAVVSGLMAAEEVRRLTPTGTAIEPIRPDTYPQAMLSTMKTLAMPSAYAAKALSVWSEMVWSGCSKMFPNG
jgi:hypothetical protein